MKRRGMWIGITWIGLALMLQAGEKDFWAAKPFTEWTQKEVDKLLRNSPWSRSVMISSVASGQRGGRYGESAPDDPLGAGVPSSSGDEGGDFGGRGGLGSLSAGPGAPIYIWWYGRPVREALARRIQLTNPEATQQQMDNFLNYRSTTHYALLLTGALAGLRGAASPEGLQKLKKETYLEKKGKVRIPLDDLALPSGPGQPLVLRFLKQVDGRPTVTPADKEVELTTRIGPERIRARFKIADMMVNGELEL